MMRKFEMLTVWRAHYSFLKWHVWQDTFGGRAGAPLIDVVTFGCAACKTMADVGG